MVHNRPPTEVRPRRQKSTRRYDPPTRVQTGSGRLGAFKARRLGVDVDGASVPQVRYRTPKRPELAAVSSRDIPATGESGSASATLVNHWKCEADTRDGVKRALVYFVILGLGCGQIGGTPESADGLDPLRPLAEEFRQLFQLEDGWRPDLHEIREMIARLSEDDICLAAGNCLDHPRYQNPREVCLALGRCSAEPDIQPAAPQR